MGTICVDLLLCVSQDPNPRPIEPKRVDAVVVRRQLCTGGTGFRTASTVIVSGETVIQPSRPRQGGRAFYFEQRAGVCRLKLIDRTRRWTGYCGCGEEGCGEEAEEVNGWQTEGPAPQPSPQARIPVGWKGGLKGRGGARATLQAASRGGYRLPRPLAWTEDIPGP